MSYRGSALCQSQKPYFRRSAAEHKAVGLVVGGFNDGEIRNIGQNSVGVCGIQMRRIIFLIHKFAARVSE